MTETRVYNKRLYSLQSLYSQSGPLQKSLLIPGLEQLLSIMHRNHFESVRKHSLLGSSPRVSDSEGLSGEGNMHPNKSQRDADVPCMGATLRIPDLKVGRDRWSFSILNHLQQMRSQKADLSSYRRLYPWSCDPGRDKISLKKLIGKDKMERIRKYRDDEIESNRE